MSEHELPHATLILGGARSGKSAYAEQLPRDGDRVLFVATAEASDEDMTARIARHRSSRPQTWETLEEPIGLADALRTRHASYDVIIIDCLTVWISNLMFAAESGESGGEEEEAFVRHYVAELLDVIQESPARWILVSNEVGLGVVPATTLGRRYRDHLGRANQMVASEASRVLLLVAGIPMTVK